MLRARRSRLQPSASRRGGSESPEAEPSAQKPRAEARSRELLCLTSLSPDHLPPRVWMTHAMSTTPAASASSSTSRDAGRTPSSKRYCRSSSTCCTAALRLRGEHRRRRRHPDPDARQAFSGRSPQRSASRFRRPASTAPDSCSLPRRRGRAGAMSAADRADRRRRRTAACSAGALVPTADARNRRVGAGDEAGHRAGVHSSGLRARQEAQGSGSETDRR